MTKREKAKIAICDICADTSRDTSLLTIVSTDTDLDSFEKGGAYRGLYFVLGGIIPLLDENPEQRIRAKELVSLTETRAKEGLKEIILALNATAEGEHTANYLVSLLSPLVKTDGIKISHLGRGLSTGTELEYADPDTIKNALKHRE